MLHYDWTKNGGQVSGCTGPTGLLMGATILKAVNAPQGVSVLESVSDGAFSVEELHKTIGKLKGRIRVPVQQYVELVVSRDRLFPLNHIRVILNRNGDDIAAYGTIFQRRVEGRTDPVYIILPQLDDNAAGLLELLRVLTRLMPETFPDIKTRDWLDSDEFAFSEERLIDGEVRSKLDEVNSFVVKKRGEKDAIRKTYAFIKRLLIATEDLQDHADRLSFNVKRALSFIGFEVEDIDAKIRGAIKQEDFWVRDGDFLAITEVSGTKNKNPKVKEFNDILGRMATIFKRRDLVPDASSVSGLLILNYDVDTHPGQRPVIYGGENEHIIEAAIENQIGLLSTVELYKIAVGVKDGRITKEQARGIIKQFGRITF